MHLRFTRNLLSSRTKSAAGGGAVDDSFLDEFSDGGVKPLETDMKLAAQPLLRLRFVVSGEALDDLSLEIGQIAGPRRRADDLEMRRRRRVSAKRQLYRLAGRCVPLLHGQLECATPTFQIEVALTPGVEISRATQAEPGLVASRPGLARVVDDEDCDMVLTLKLSEVSEYS